MDTFSEIYLAVYDDLTASQDSTLYNITSVKRAVNRAYDKCAALFRWAKTEDALVTSTQKDIEYYDFPSNWRPDSAWALEVDGVDFDKPLLFDDYRYEKINGLPSGIERRWSQQACRFFIYPIPTAAGTDNITIWGVKVPELLVEDTDTTIFSYNLRNCNDAIVQEAVAILKNKTDDKNTSQFRSTEAKSILITEWTNTRKEQMKYQKSRPMFDVPDYFPKGNVKTLTGKFNQVV